MRVGMREFPFFLTCARVGLERFAIHWLCPWYFRTFSSLWIYHSVGCAVVLVLLIFVSMIMEEMVKSSQRKVLLENHGTCYFKPIPQQEIEDIVFRNLEQQAKDRKLQSAERDNTIG